MWLNRWHGQYNPDKKQTSCNPTIYNNDTLMTDDWEFMDNEKLAKCSCANKQTCYDLVRLLKEHKPDEARKLLDYIISK